MTNQYQLTRRLEKHVDQYGNERTLINIYLHEDGKFLGVHDYKNKFEYRKWLRGLLHFHRAKVRQVNRQPDEEYEPTDKSSFYLLYGDGNLWHCMMVIAFANDPSKAWWLDESVKSLEEALMIVKEHSNSPDFEVNTMESSEIFPLTDDNLLIACLKYSGT